MAEFRTDVGAFVGREAVDAVVVSGRWELPPLANIHYVLSMRVAAVPRRLTAAVAHRNADGVTVLMLFARPWRHFRLMP
jgi:hypothetical protein